MPRVTCGGFSQIASHILKTSDHMCIYCKLECPWSLSVCLIYHMPANVLVSAVTCLKLNRINRDEVLSQFCCCLWG